MKLWRVWRVIERVREESVLAGYMATAMIADLWRWLRRRR